MGVELDRCGEGGVYARSAKGFVSFICKKDHLYHNRKGPQQGGDKRTIFM